MKKKDFKPGVNADRRYRSVPLTVIVIILCGVSFYLGGIYHSEKNTIIKKNARSPVQSVKEIALAPLQIKSVEFPECSIDHQDYTPCTDPKVILASSLFVCATTRCSYEK